MKEEKRNYYKLKKIMKMQKKVLKKLEK